MSTNAHRILEFKNALSPGDCASLIEEARPRLTPAKVGRGKARHVHPARVADNYKYRRDTEITLGLKKKVADFLNLTDLDFIEPLEIIRYKPGGFFFRHNDSVMGDRPYTFNLYLNHDYEGGQLFFDQIGVLFESIPAGTGLLWENKKDMTHEARPVTDGEKWLLSLWVSSMTSEERATSGQDPLGTPTVSKDSPIIIPGEND